VDFGPAPGGDHALAIRQWRDWWEKHPTTATLATKGDETTRLADALRDNPGLLATYRDTKGVQYTEALALAVSRAPGEESRQRFREALADRMARLTDKTLLTYLQDEDG
jgi:hypothetical protein